MSTSPLFYQKIGNGPRHLILFHGFGQTHAAFDSWKEIFPADYTVLAVDLFHHGESKRADRPLSQHEWKLALEALFLTHQIDTCQIAGFSLGGRFAIASAMNFPDRVSQLILLAPDGIHVNPWYRLATSSVGHPLFRHLMHHPFHFNYLLNTFQKLNLVSSGMIRFAQKELQEPHKRKQVYQTWTYFKNLRHLPAHFSQTFNRHGIQIDLILGEHDAVIPPKELIPLTKHIERLNTHILPFKHHQLIEGSKTLIPSLLQKANL